MSSKAGLDMNVKKTETMTISKQPKGKRIGIKVDNQTVEPMHKFKYLGTKITDDGEPDTEITNRISIAKSKFSSISRCLSIPIKLKILKCYLCLLNLHVCGRRGLVVKASGLGPRGPGFES